MSAGSTSVGSTTRGARHLGGTMRRDAWWLELLPVVILLGVTCYYYRKAYYRAFFLDPPACAVSEGGKHRYRGETGFPFILQNLHRYFLYVGFIFLIFLWRDAVRGFFFGGRFGVGIGSLLLLFNVILLTVYALSCHSLRHLLGGRLDCFSCVALGAARHTTWGWLSVLNERHMLYAWISLIAVGLTDLYVRLVASGTITDLRIL